MAADSSRSPAPSADSYIGSLISLTSKCEIRYEGILYNINTEESSIGLRNVRSFGTEGRKKDGPQIPASDKIYEYILFRGSDIKDLQVKSSPSVQTPSIHNDPAIIQSHYAHPASTSASLTSAVHGAVPDASSHTAQMGLPRSTFQGGLPLYQPGGNPGSWGAAPTPPTANGSGLAMPMYWQGFYAPSGGLPHLQPPSLLRPPPGLPLAQSIQQPLQYPGVNASFQSGTSNLAEFPPPLFPSVGSTQTSTALSSTVAAPTQASLLAPEISNMMPNISSLTSLPTTGSNLMPNISSASIPAVGSTLIPNIPSVTSIPAAVSSLIPNISHVTSLPSTTLGANLPLVSPLTSGHDPLVPSSQGISSTIGNKPVTVPAPALGYQTVSQAMPSVVGSSSSNLVEPSASLVTPDQLFQPSPSGIPSSRPSQTSTKDIEVKSQEEKKQPTAVESSMRVPSKFKEPILPLPKPAHQRPNRAVMHTHHYSRGRGRGRGNGYSHPVTKFTEEFDFMAMNEKFNKDEVWGHLGKSKALSHEREGGENDDESDDDIEDNDTETHKPEIKPVYVKDDFFDTLSCNTLNRDSRGGRMKFSEQLKIDTETFGDFPRHRPNRGGRGLRGGGRARGSYYGRGYGYVSRGRGHAVSNRAS